MGEMCQYSYICVHVDMFSFNDNINEYLQLHCFTYTTQGVPIKSHYMRKIHNLFRVDENSLEQCCAAHIVQCCQ